jgi:hypothetical protein
MSDGVCGHLKARQAAMVLISFRVLQSSQGARSSF